MLRETNVQTLHWADKTMSVLKARQLEACESRLASLPDFGLFDGCDESNVETLWACSFEAQEQPIPTALHDPRKLQAKVLTTLPAEAALLSMEEHHLLDRLLALGGDAELMDWEEPRERNSNLLPVKAKGEVRLRSVVSLGNLGRMCTPRRMASRSWVS